MTDLELRARLIKLAEDARKAEAAMCELQRDLAATIAYLKRTWQRE